MTIYFFMIIMTFGLGVIFEKKNRKLYAFLVLLMFSLTMGLRHYTIGNDTQTYVNIFYRISNLGIESYKGNEWLEIGWVYVNYFISRFSQNYTIFLLLVSMIINIGLVYYIYKYSKDMTFSFLLIFFSRIFFSEMVIMRQFFAIIFIIFGLRYLVGEKKSFIKYFICVLLATLIHRSCLLFLLLYFIKDLKLTTNKKIWISVTSTAIFFALYNVINFITNKIGFYQNYIENFGSNNLASIFDFAIYLTEMLFIDNLYKKEIKDETGLDNLFYNMLFFGMIISFLSIRINILSRILHFFDVTNTIFLANRISQISNQKNKKILKIIVLTLYFISMCIVLIYRPDWYNVVPYRFYK